MLGFTLRKSTVFDWNGKSFRIERTQPNGDLLLEDLADTAMSIISRNEFLFAFKKGEVTFVRLSTEHSHNKVPIYGRPLVDLCERDKAEIVRRRAYLEKIYELGRPVFTSAFLKPIVEATATELGDTKPPSAITIWRWHRRYLSSGDTRALIPRFDRRGSRKLRQTPLVLQLATEAIDEAFEASPRANIPTIYSRLLAKIEAVNRQLDDPRKHPIPSMRTLRRMFGRLEVYDKVRLTEGKAAAEKQFRLIKHSVETKQILERVEIDHTPLDLFLVDEARSLPLGRPTLTIVLDHYSRMILGYHLSFDSPSAAAVMGALRHAILPKEKIADVLPDLKIEHQWEPYGVPDLIVVDNGLEFHGNSLESVAFDLGSTLQFCPKHEPRFKGAVERYLGTFNRFFAHQLPGTSLSRLQDRGDYDPQKHALLTLGEFNYLLQKWILDVYSQTIHRTTWETPWARWQEGLQFRQPSLPTSATMLDRRIGQVEERSLRQDGIVINGIRYNGAALSPILRTYGSGTKVRVVYNAEDLGEIYVWGPGSDEPITISALNQQYARGLTRHQNELIQQALRAKGLSGHDPRALEEARQQLVQAINSLLGSRKQKDRRRAAKIQGTSSSKVIGLKTISEDSGYDKSKATRHVSKYQPTSGILNDDVLPVARYPLVHSQDLRQEIDQ